MNTRQANQNIGAFVAEHGRPPTLEHERTPWLTQGWMLHYVQLAHLTHPEVPNRWGYAFEIIEHGELPSYPIPRIEFGHPSQGAGGALLERALGMIASTHGTWPAMRLLCEWLGYGLMVHPTPPQLDEALARRLYVELDLCELLLDPADYIGWLISGRKGRGRGWNPTAFFPTPHGVVEAMVEMAMHDEGEGGEEDLRLKSVLDPCLGTGRMLLHASNHSLVLHGCDIDPLVLLGAKINGALYAPWMAFPMCSFLSKDSPLPGPEDLEAVASENPDAQAHLERITDALGRAPRGADGGPARALALHDRQLELFEL
jgi:hypothetical protein